MLFDQQGAVLYVSLTDARKLLKLDPSQVSLISKIGVSKTLKDVAVNRGTSEAFTICDNDRSRIKLPDRTDSYQAVARAS